MDRKTISIGFGLVGIAIGAFELLVPRSFARLTGIVGQERAVQLMGIREFGSGVALLSPTRPFPWMMVRAAGDLFDAAIFASAMGTSNPKRNAARMMFVGSLSGFCVDAIFAMRVKE